MIKEFLAKLFGFDNSKRRRAIWLVAMAVAGLIAIGTTVVIASNQPQPTQTSSACPAQPDFDTILPAGKTIEQLGGWKALCPPDGTVSYVYQDQIESTAISVTLQPLPDSFADDPSGQLRQLASDANYTQQIESSDGTTAYVGTSAQGPQSAMLIKHGLMVFIKTESTIGHQAWQQYIDRLN